MIWQQSAQRTDSGQVSTRRDRWHSADRFQQQLNSGSSSSSSSSSGHDVILTLYKRACERRPSHDVYRGAAAAAVVVIARSGRVRDRSHWLNDGCARNQRADADGDDHRRHRRDAGGRRSLQLRAARRPATAADGRRPRPPDRRRAQPARTRPRTRGGPGGRRPLDGVVRGPADGRRRRRRRVRQVEAERQHDRMRDRAKLRARRWNRRQTRLIFPLFVFNPTNRLQTRAVNGINEEEEFYSPLLS